MAITPFKVTQGHRFWYEQKARIICDSLLVVNNSNLPPTSHRFRIPRYDYGGLLVKYVAVDRGVTLCSALVHYYNIRCHGTKNIALSCRTYVGILNRLEVTYECNGRTDGQTLAQQMPRLTTLHRQNSLDVRLCYNVASTFNISDYLYGKQPVLQWEIIFYLTCTI